MHITKKRRVLRKVKTITAKRHRRKRIKSQRIKSQRIRRKSSKFNWVNGEKLVDDSLSVYNKVNKKIMNLVTSLTVCEIFYIKKVLLCNLFVFVLISCRTLMTSFEAIRC